MLFCLNTGVLNSDLTYTSSLSIQENLIPLKTGVASHRTTEGYAFKFADSSNGLIWNSLTPTWRNGTFKNPVQINDYLYYFSFYLQYNEDLGINEGFNAIRKIPYSPGILGDAQDVFVISKEGILSNINNFYVNNTFYCFVDNKVIITSDFINFTTYDLPFWLENIIYFKNKFYSLGSYLDPFTYYSSIDGITWISEGTLPITVYEIAYNNDVLIAINNSQMLTFDGITWSTVINLPEIINISDSIPWNDIAYNSGIFCIVGDSFETGYPGQAKSIIGTSKDNGASWQIQSFINLDLYEFYQVVPMNPPKFWTLFKKTSEL